MISNQENADKFAEQSSEGPTHALLFGEAKRLNAYTFAGYIEKGDDGKLLKNYRKRHLYYMDTTWATPSEQWETVQMSNVDGISFKTCLCICADIVRSYARVYDCVAPRRHSVPHMLAQPVL